MPERGYAVARSPLDLGLEEQVLPFTCPSCHGLLTESQSRYTCVRCASEYPIASGIPDFCPQTELYWGELSSEEMEEVVTCARERGYDAAADIASKYSPGLREYLLGHCRIDWAFHCAPVSGWKTCLDIGSGWGTLSRGLLKLGLKVWSLEIMRQRLAFQDAFRRFEKLDGLTLLRGTANSLPFPDGSFDLIAANGIIQWVGLADPSRRVADLQRDFLKECRRVLKPNGVLYLGCENRFGLDQWMGRKDHSGLPFTSVMPRKLADLAVRRFRKTGGKFTRKFRMDNEWQDYRTYTYSVRGYEKLLKSAAFEEVQSFWAYPSNNEPQIMGRIGDGRALKGLLDFSWRTLDTRIRGSKASRTVLRLRSLAGFSPAAKVLSRLSSDLAFFARPVAKPADETTLEDIAGSYAVRCGGSNKIIWWNVEGSHGGQVVKMARFPADEKSVKADEERTGKYNQIPVSNERHGQWTLFREPLLPVRTMDALSEKENLAAVATLLELQRKTTTAFWGTADLSEDIASHLKRFCDLVRDKELCQLAERDCERVSSHFTGIRLPVVTEHGDYCRNNILFDSEGRIYLIDWSHGREAGEPLFDLSMLSQIHWKTWREARQRNGKPTSAPAPTLASMIAAFTKPANLTPEVVYAYYPYSLMRRIIRTAPGFRHVLIKQFRNRYFPQPD